MNGASPSTLALVREMERRIRLELIERAARDGLTADEALRAVTIEHNWRTDREALAAQREAPDH